MAQQNSDAVTDDESYIISDVLLSQTAASSSDTSIEFDESVFDEFENSAENKPDSPKSEFMEEARGFKGESILKALLTSPLQQQQQQQQQQSNAQAAEAERNAVLAHQAELQQQAKAHASSTGQAVGTQPQQDVDVVNVVISEHKAASGGRITVKATTAPEQPPPKRVKIGEVGAVSYANTTAGLIHIPGAPVTSIAAATANPARPHAAIPAPIQIAVDPGAARTRALPSYERQTHLQLDQQSAPMVAATAPVPAQDDNILDRYLAQRTTEARQRHQVLQLQQQQQLPSIDHFNQRQQAVDPGARAMDDRVWHQDPNPGQIQQQQWHPPLNVPQQQATMSQQVDAAAMNLAPPPVLPRQQQYTTTLPLQPIATPNAQRQITGIYPSYSFDGHNLRLVDLFTHLDLADFLPTSTLAAIRSRAYVDFAKLLPDNVDDPLADDQNKEIAEVGGIKLQAKTKGTKNNAIDGIIKWCRSFCVWAFVFLDTNPDEAKGLFQYMHHMLEGDKRFMWNMVYRYDKEVRLSMEKDYTRRIGPIDLRKWQQVVSYIKSKPVYNNNYVQQYNRKKDIRDARYNPYSGQPSYKKDNRGGRMVHSCNDFNRGMCHREKCKFAHICKRCKSDKHAAIHCKVADSINDNN